MESSAKRADAVRTGYNDLFQSLVRQKCVRWRVVALPASSPPVEGCSHGVFLVWEGSSRLPLAWEGRQGGRLPPPKQQGGAQVSTERSKEQSGATYTYVYVYVSYVSQEARGSQEVLSLNCLYISTYDRSASRGAEPELRSSEPRGSQEERALSHLISGTYVMRTSKRNEQELRIRIRTTYDELRGASGAFVISPYIPSFTEESLLEQRAPSYVGKLRTTYLRRGAKRGGFSGGYVISPYITCIYEENLAEARSNHYVYAYVDHVRIRSSEIRAKSGELVAAPLPRRESPTEGVSCTGQIEDVVSGGVFSLLSTHLLRDLYRRRGRINVLPALLHTDRMRCLCEYIHTAIKHSQTMSPSSLWRTGMGCYNDMRAMLVSCWRVASSRGRDVLAVRASPSGSIGDGSSHALRENPLSKFLEWFLASSTENNFFKFLGVHYG